MLMRLMDFLKSAGITAVFVSLTAGGETLEKTERGHFFSHRHLDFAARHRTER